MSKKSGRKPKFPKSVAGVPVPKELRKPAARIVAAATSPAGLELIATALGMAAAAATAAAVERERAKRRPEVEGGGDVAREAPTGVQPPRASNDPHEVGLALGRMAEAALTGWLRHRS